MQRYINAMMMKLRRRRIRSIMVHWLVIRSYRPCSFWLMNPAALRPPSPNTGSDHDEKNMRTIRQEMHSFFQLKYLSTFHLHLLVWIFQCCSDKKNKTKVWRDPILESEKKNVSDQRLILIVCCWLEECYLRTKSIDAVQESISC